MLTLRAEDILRLRSPGGDRFADFLNKLIRAHARAHGIPDTAIRTNLKTTVGDGGVDAEVNTKAGHDPTGRMTFATAWQFKATAAGQGGPAELRAEINKPYAKQLVKAGASYAFCICDQLTPQRKDAWERELQKEALKINQNSAPTQLLDSDDIAAWANQYPALALAERQYLAGSALTFQRWGKTATGRTPFYVTSPSIEAATQAIQRHVAFIEQPNEVVLTFRGPIGVGKSRLVYEALKTTPGADGLVLYTLSEDAAIQLAYQIANTDAHAILVADECTVQTADQLRQLLDGQRDHVRVIVIESTEGAYRKEDSDALWIEEINDTVLSQILDSNFPQVPPERRRAYASLAQGFVRFAVELCRNDADFPTDQILRPASSVRTYLRKRLTSEEQEVVAAIALVDGVGFRDDVSAELGSLASLVGLDVDRIKSVVRRVREAPGFLATAGRYLYVKPPIVAQVAFADAWVRWGADDPNSFLTKIANDPALFKRFLRRVAQSGSPEIRALVAGMHSAWANSLTPDNLMVPADVDRLITFIEVDPLRYLPVLRRLVEKAPQEQLSQDTSVGPERRNVRRELVRVAERIAAIPECFRDAEAILLQLTIAESEPKLGNNATETYDQLFQPILSGTQLPFLERLEVLGMRMGSDNEQVAARATSALGDVFNATFSRGLGEPLVAGRITGNDWEPVTSAEHQAGLLRAFELLKDATASPFPAVQMAAWNVAIDKLDMLWRHGFAKDMAALFPPDALSPELRARAIARVEWLLGWGRRRGNGEPNGPIPGEDELRSLVAQLRPTDLHGRLLTAVGVERWQRTAFRDEQWREELSGLARELVENLDQLAAEVDWLCSDEAPAAYELGVAVGIVDATGAALPLVVEAARRNPRIRFAQGYVAGLVTVDDMPLDPLNEALDRLQTDAPTVAFSLATSAGDSARAFERALRLVDRKVLLAAELGTFAFGIGERPMTETEFEEALKRLVDAVEKKESMAGKVALDFASRRLFRDQRLPKPIVSLG
jgi:hypothetical protein